jgi:ADP-L-glycero-D-manno-heptose 6-epimerase
VSSEKILITGSRGFIGSNLLGAAQLGCQDIETINEEFYDDPNWINTLVNWLDKKRPTCIFHIGACSDTLNQDVEYMMLRNYQSTVTLADWAFKNSCKLVYSSSAAVYGTNNLFPSNLYGWSKYVAENYVIARGGIALRYFNVYGPGEEHKGRMSSFVYQAYNMSRKKIDVLLFPGFPKRDFVYIKDVVAANIFALEHFYDLCGASYEVGTGKASTFESVLNLSGIPFEYADESDVPLGYQFFTCSNSAKWMDGWKPEFKLEQGIHDYLTYLGETT